MVFEPVIPLYSARDTCQGAYDTDHSPLRLESLVQEEYCSIGLGWEYQQGMGSDNNVYL